MTKALIAISFLFICIWSCRSKEEIPADIIPEAKMEAILWDMIRADQFLTSYVFYKDSSVDQNTHSIRLYQQVLTLHNTDRDDFEKSFSFYKSHPELLKQVLDSLNKPGRDIVTEEKAVDTVVNFSSTDSVLKRRDSVSNPSKRIRGDMKPE